ncbi:MAG: phage tail sheath C-terminal domain-containing protein, partial [Bacteroidota bacterium]
MITQTPGVYINEKNNYPSSVAGVSTAVPVFIGYTAKAQNKPKLIKGLFDFEKLFGSNYQPDFLVNPTSFEVSPDTRFLLGDTLELYFKNGGGECYIMSAGTFGNFDHTSIVDDLSDQVDLLDTLDEATLILIPDLHIQFTDVNGVLNGLTDAEFGMVAGKLINKCALLTNKFAILDVKEMDNGVNGFRSSVSPTAPEDLKHAAVYYPWLNTIANYSVSYNQINYAHSNATATSIDGLNTDLTDISNHFGGLDQLQTLKDELIHLLQELNNANNGTQEKSRATNVFKFLFGRVKKLVTLKGALASGSVLIPDVNELKGVNTPLHREISRLYRSVQVLQQGNHLNQIGTPNEMTDGMWSGFTEVPTDKVLDLYNDSAYDPAVTFTNYQQLIADINNGQYFDTDIIFSAIAGIVNKAQFRKYNLERELFKSDSTYQLIHSNIQKLMSQLPSQGAVAGLYCKNDRERGIWKSPANLTVQGGAVPVIEVSNSEQDGLNVDAIAGKSVNVIRTFTGKGPVIWGARTLAGNSSEWKFIAVRRYYSYVQDSLAKSLNSLVYEPNNARTWVKIKALVTSFLVKQWEAGALVGANMKDAFFVEVGSTTTSDTEISNGIVNIRIGMAVARPAEFIIVEFSHKT